MRAAPVTDPPRLSAIKILKSLHSGSGTPHLTRPVTTTCTFACGVSQATSRSLVRPRSGRVHTLWIADQPRIDRWGEGNVGVDLAHAPLLALGTTHVQAARREVQVGSTVLVVYQLNSANYPTPSNKSSRHLPTQREPRAAPSCPTQDANARAPHARSAQQTYTTQRRSVRLHHRADLHQALPPRHRCERDPVRRERPHPYQCFPSREEGGRSSSIQAGAACASSPDHCAAVMPGQLAATRAH